MSIAENMNIQIFFHISDPRIGNAPSDKAASHQTQRQIADPAAQEHRQRRHIGGQVDGLGQPCRLVQGQVRHSGQQQEQKGARARAVEAVVDAQHQGNGQTDEQGLAEGVRFPFLGQPLRAEQIAGGQGEDDQHEDAERAGGDRQRQLCAQAGASQGKEDTQQRLPPGDEPAAGVANGGCGGAHGGTELVGAQGVVNGDAGDEVGGQGDQSAAAGDGVHKSGDAHQGAEEEVGQNAGHGGRVPSFSLRMDQMRDSRSGLERSTCRKVSKKDSAGGVVFTLSWSR